MGVDKVLLAVVSDGLMEARNPNGVFWDDREMPFIFRQHRKPVKSLPAALCIHTDAGTAGAEPYDDMAVAGLRVRS